MELRALRAHRQYPGTQLEWFEMPLFGPRMEGDSYFTMLIHWTGVTLLVIGTVAAIRLDYSLTDDFLPLLHVGPDVVTWMILEIAVGMVGYLWGKILLHPFGTPFAGESHYALSNAGILFGGYLFPWQVFSHYSIQKDEGILRLWSRFQRGYCLFVFRPVSQDVRRCLWETIEDRLSPAAPAEVRRSGWWGMPLVMVFVTLAAIAIGAGLLVLLESKAIILMSVLVVMFYFSGGVIMLRGAYGGLARPIHSTVGD